MCWCVGIGKPRDDADLEARPDDIDNIVRMSWIHADVEMWAPIIATANTNNGISVDTYTVANKLNTRTWRSWIRTYSAYPSSIVGTRYIANCAKVAYTWGARVARSDSC